MISEDTAAHVYKFPGCFTPGDLAYDESGHLILTVDAVAVAALVALAASTLPTGGPPTPSTHSTPNGSPNDSPSNPIHRS